MIFDPKWLPALKEYDIPVQVEHGVFVVGADHQRDLLNDIRRLQQDPLPMVPYYYPSDPTRFISPETPLGGGTAIVGSAIANMKFTTFVDSIDLADYAAPDSKSVVNKALRKKRDAQKASQNARGRKWWEHR